MSEKFKLALLGTRGIPAAYGGFETFAEELATRLVVRGHAVTVYGRRKFFDSSKTEAEYLGVKTRNTPTLMHKYLETPLHSLTSFIDLYRRRFDLVLLCNAANSPFAFLGRLRGLPVLINVDGIERKRSKWNFLGRLWYRLGELCSVLFANKIIADADVIAEYYRKHYRISPAVIRYGANPQPISAGKVLAQFGLKPGEYILYVSRLEPENNALGVIQAYAEVATKWPLVIVGDAPYADEYKKKLKSAADHRVIFTGFQFGENYRELRSNPAIYIQATEVGGTHPALVEAMAYGNCIIANDVPEHREVLKATGLYYPKNDFAALAKQLSSLLINPVEMKVLGMKAQSAALQDYSWDSIVNQYETLICEFLQK